MRRVVVTGMGIWSCIGQDLETVTEILKQGRSGIIFDAQRIEFGLRSGLMGNVPRPNLKPLLSRKFRATMSGDTEYAYMAARQAFEQAGINDDYLRQNEVGIIYGNDGNGLARKEGNDILNKEHSALMLGPTALFRGETSSVTMNLSSVFHLRGISCIIGAACASGSQTIGIASLFIRTGLQQMVLVGGSQEIDLGGFASVDALEALSLRNDDPQHASRPFDRDRDGMVNSGGAAALVLEEYEHAIARGATILAEVVGYGFSSNGIEDISMSSADGEYRAMKRALDDAGIKPEDIDYVNAHATSTIQGDIEEAKALTKLFGAKTATLKEQGTRSKEHGAKTPWISSTKSMTGHENWMAGASEAVYSILMMQNSFVAPNINLENVIDEAKDLRIARETIYTPVNTVLSNSSGMGGTNSALVFRRIQQ